MVRSLCFDFSVVQCSIRGSRARYVLRQEKNKQTIETILVVKEISGYANNDTGGISTQ